MKGARQHSIPRSEAVQGIRALSIALITGTYPLLTTTFIDREIRALRERGVHIEILALRRPDEGVPLSSGQLDAADAVRYLLPVSWLLVLTSHLRALLRHPIRFWSTLSLLLKGDHPSTKTRLRTILHFGEGVVATEMLRHSEFDEIQAHFVDRAATVALVVSRLLNKPYTLSVHAGADVFVEKVLLPEKLGHARKVVTCTKYNKAFLTGLVGDEIGESIVSIPHGLDLSLYKPAPKKRTGRPLLIAVGQLTERKGLMDLVEACAILRSDGLDFGCRIIGSGPLSVALSARIDKLGLAHTVEMVGPLSHDEVIEEYRNASLFVLPCIESADGNRDGIPNVIPEAMAMSLPVASTRVSAIPEVVEDGRTGVLVGPNDPQSLAKALHELIADKGRRAELGDSGRRKVVEVFDIEANADLLVEALWPDVGLAEGKESARVKWTVVAWAPYSRRSEMFARELGGSLHCIHYLKFRSPIHAPLKYVLQAIKTLEVLIRERPDAVHVQNPPFVCEAVVWLYTKIFGGTYVTEYHSAAFGTVWRWALPVQRFLARSAAVNIVTSAHWADLIKRWGGRSLVMYDPFLPLGEGVPYSVREGFNIVFAGVFAPDEPILEVIEAASRLPEVNVYVTGDASMRPVHLGPVTENVVFTGFLDLNTEYVGLLNAADAVMVLTTRDNTLQLAGCEAIGVGKPVITSDWEYLRELFGEAATYVFPHADAIEQGMRRMVERHYEYQIQVEVTRDRGKRRWEERLSQLRTIVDSDLSHRSDGRQLAS